MTVGAALVQVLRSAGVRYVFGNPGIVDVAIERDAKAMR